MKKTNRTLPILLTALMSATLAMPLFACGGGTDNSAGDKNQAKVNVISASLLDGKVANLLSANGIAIQDKTQNEGPRYAMKSKNGRNIVAKADEETVEQPETELVKQTEEGVEDGHFHDGEKGEYSTWNDG